MHQAFLFAVAQNWLVSVACKKQTNKQTLTEQVKCNSYQSREIQTIVFTRKHSLAMRRNWLWIYLNILLPARKKIVTYKMIKDRTLPMPDKGSLFSSPLSCSRSAATAVRYWLKTSVTWRLYSLRAVANSLGRSSKITLKGKRYQVENRKISSEKHLFSNAWTQFFKWWMTLSDG